MRVSSNENSHPSNFTAFQARSACAIRIESLGTVSKPTMRTSGPNGTGRNEILDERNALNRCAAVPETVR